MALAKCIDCDMDVSDIAEACPHCGRPNPSKGSIRRRFARSIDGGFLLDKCASLLILLAGYSLFEEIQRYQQALGVLTAMISVALAIGVYRSWKSAHIASVGYGAFLFSVGAAGVHLPLALLVAPGFYSLLRLTGLIGPVYEIRRTGS